MFFQMLEVEFCSITQASFQGMTQYSVKVIDTVYMSKY